MESCDDAVHESRDDDSCHGDSGLLNMLAEVASATLHNDSLARKTRGNPRGRPRKQTNEGRPDSESESGDANKLSLPQLQLLTEKQLVDLFSVMDSDEIRRTFSYSCHLLPRCQFNSSSFGSEMKARQEMQKHLSEHVRDLMRKAHDSPGFRFTATPVAPSKVKKIAGAVKEASPVRKPAANNSAKDKNNIVKIKLQTPKGKLASASAASAVAPKASRGPAKRGSQPAVSSPPAAPTKSPRGTVKAVKEEPISKPPPVKRKRRAAAGFEVDEDLDAESVVASASLAEHGTVKDKWDKIYNDKFRAVDNARFRAIQGDLPADDEHDFGAVAEEVVVTSEDTAAITGSAGGASATALPDHDYNIYRVNRKAKAVAKAAAEAADVDTQIKRNQDEQMEAVAQSVAAAAQEKEKLKRKRGATTQHQASGVPLHSFMLEETTKQSKVVVKNKPTEPLPCVGSEVVVGYNPNEFYLMKSSELPVIEDLRQQKSTSATTTVVTADAASQPQFTFVCMNEDGELIEETVEEPGIFLDEDEEQLLEQVAAQASNRGRTVNDVAEKDMVDIARKRAKVKPKFVSQSAGERELALQYIGELKQQRGSGADSLHCKICTPVRTFTAPTTLLSHYRSHAGIKPYECRRCGAVFTRQHSLNYHMLIHANMSRFTCPDCHRQFRHPSHYKEHRRRHTGEAPYECSDCMQRFRTRNSYKRHLMTRHGKLLTSTGGLIILPEEEFNKVRCKPRPVRSGGRSAGSDAADDIAPVASTSKPVSGKAEGRTRGSKASKAHNEDGSGNFEQQRQEDLIRLLYQRLTSPNEHSSGGESDEDDGESRGGSPLPADGTTMEVHEDQIQVMEVMDDTVVVESPDVAAAVVVESVPNSGDQVVEEQCEVVADENWGSFVHLTVDGQNNVIFLDESQVGTEVEAENGTTTLLIQEPLPTPAPVVIPVTRQRTSTRAKVTRRTTATAAAASASISAEGSAASSSGDDLLSFVQGAGVMVQHILDIQDTS